ncbi:DUF4097 family beta strand repeat-containing protein [Streptomyces diastaticus]|uniref:DUF4097 family beta strand repeat-containing protein n=1 Tax=Streptomyces TaxID=1883 RepID=UPI0013750283|nr:DUF4097 family beta strand repeat-containing protein [Streptomyces sp. TSRI0384-2]NEE37949.1 DUF4097 domain-containing protein [Streptomyces sp. SID7982]NEE50788.1 DUF4097 domain-containing protein [Streptomyces sp. SID8455]
MSARTASRTRRLAAFGAGAAALALLTTGCAGDASADGGAEPEHKSFALSGRTLTVDSDDSRIELVTGDGDEVRVTRWFTGRALLGSTPRADWTVEGDELKLRVSCSGIVTTCDAEHRIEVPADVAVSLRTQDGGVTAKGFTTPLTLRGSDASLTVEDVSGPLDLHSADGAITARSVSSSRVRARTEDGSLTLALARAPQRIDASSEDGSVTVELPEAAYDVRTKVQDGRTNVSVLEDRASSRVVSVTTQDGNVTVRPAG